MLNSLKRHLTIPCFFAITSLLAPTVGQAAIDISVEGGKNAPLTITVNSVGVADLFTASSTKTSTALFLRFINIWDNTVSSIPEPELAYWLLIPASTGLRLHRRQRKRHQK